MTEPQVHELFEPVTGSWQYVVADPATSSAVIIDPVLNFDAAKGVISTESADALIDVVTERGYSVDMILETHIHADHMTSAAYIQAMLAKKQEHKPLIGIGSRIENTQKMFGERYGISAKEYKNVFDRLWADDEEFRIGSLTARAIHLPGHTPDHMGYQIGSELITMIKQFELELTRFLLGNVFVGDSIFYVDIGSARADFPGGSPEAVYSSGRKLLSLPDDFKIWVGHDYPPQGRDEPVPYVTVKRQREENKHLKDSVQREEFVKMRRERDETLAAPRLIHPSLQINIRGGHLPAATASGLRVVHLPLQVPDPAW
jgi:glyoxylase-like metal-dependent hydrolase (beta-lactamase superfamily II)